MVLFGVDDVVVFNLKLGVLPYLQRKIQQKIIA